MNYKVVYFTRSGISQRVAEKIGAKLSCEVAQVTDNMNWNGIFGFLKGGYYASKNKDVEIKVSKNVADADELIVVSPLWAGGVVPAIRMFLKTTNPNKVHLVITSSGSTTSKREGYKSVTDVVKNNKNEDAAISGLVDSLKK